MTTLLFLLACSPSHLTVASLSKDEGIVEAFDTAETGEDSDTGIPDDTGEDLDTGDTAETGEPEDTADTEDTAPPDDTADTGDTGAVEPTWCEANYDKSIATTYLVLSEGESVTLEPCGSILHEVYCYTASGTIELAPDSTDLTDGAVVLTAYTAGLVFDGSGSAYGYCILSTDPTETRTRSGELYVTITE